MFDKLLSHRHKNSERSKFKTFCKGKTYNIPCTTIDLIKIYQKKMQTTFLTYLVVYIGTFYTICT